MKNRDFRHMFIARCPTTQHVQLGMAPGAGDQQGLLASCLRETWTGKSFGSSDRPQLSFFRPDVARPSGACKRVAKRVAPKKRDSISLRFVKHDVLMGTISQRGRDATSGSRELKLRTAKDCQFSTCFVLCDKSIQIHFNTLPMSGSCL